MAKRAKRNRTVFISHSTPDTWIAKQVAKGITRCGASIFLDDAQIQTGADFEAEILRFLNRADELVVILTPWAVDRPYVWAELGAAWARGIPIVVLLHGLTVAELQARPGAPVFLKARNCRDLNDVERYFGELKQRLRRRTRKRGKM